MPSDSSNDFYRDVPRESPDVGDGLITEVPSALETLPDGQEAVVFGDVEECRDYCHRQGDNDLGFRGTCGLCSSQDVLNQFGVDVSENDIVHYAADNGLCRTDGADASMNGGTYEWQQAQILSDHGVPAHVETGIGLNDLSDYVTDGRGVIIEVNAGVLWDDGQYFDWGQANHAIVVTGVATDPTSGDILGFYVNDSGAGQAGRYVDAQTMDSMWSQTGANCVITDVIKPSASNDAF